MKFSEQWLREWVNPTLDAAALAHRLTMAGHEVDALEALGAGLDGVVVGEVVEVGRHPDADRLSVCRVATGNGKPVEVVCGAPNVRAGMKSPYAPAGTKLPNGMKLRRSKIRGVVSNGMLCSAVELALGDDEDGIVELPDDAPAGSPLAAVLGLPDHAFDLDLTPNRGDCFSVQGIARDVSALTGTTLTAPEIRPVKATIKDKHPVELVLPEGCPRFAARVIRNTDPQARSPLWMTERLRRSGLRSISPVVDVTNYVMLELGQPLHAYDLARLNGPIRPRLATEGQELTLLDEQHVKVLPNTLVITDDSGVIGLAGMKGGLSTAVTGSTTDVFLEAAYWPPAFMAGRARQYGLHTDASLRFERGVDPELPPDAIERATALLLDIAGGEAGPMVDHVVRKHLPKRNSQSLRRKRLSQVLGTEIETDQVTGILDKLGLSPKADRNGWSVQVPSFRFDIEVEDDLVEEVARVYGYDEIPEKTAVAETPLAIAPESSPDLDRIATSLVARDYQEVITYSFIDEKLDALVSGNLPSLKLENPISSEMSVMRNSIWPGLLQAASGNLSRQQDRVRFFEIGNTYHGTVDAPREVLRLAGVALGSALEEQWGYKSQNVDFFDIKADLQALFLGTGCGDEFAFSAAGHAALQPGQAAQIKRDGEPIGVLGKIHPQVAKQFEIEQGVYAFELDVAKTFAARVPVAETISKFPAIRRDIAIVVREDVSAAQLVEAVRSAVPELVRTVRIFDVYNGPGIEAGLKSIALGLILQETSRTLTDDDADTAMAAVLGKLQQEFAAVLRD